MRLGARILVAGSLAKARQGARLAMGMSSSVVADLAQIGQSHKIAARSGKRSNAFAAPGRTVITQTDAQPDLDAWVAGRADVAI